MPDQRAAITAHLVALDEHDRGLRFGVATDAIAIARYVDAIDFERGLVLGAVTRAKALAGVAHVAFDGRCAEVGLSVRSGDRRRGVATALAAAALREAERLGADELRLHCAASNRAMRRIAVQLGMEITVDGSDLIARRRLRPVGGDEPSGAPRKPRQASVAAGGPD